jgi:hypothetical protein
VAPLPCTFNAVVMFFMYCLVCALMEERTGKLLPSSPCPDTPIIKVVGGDTDGTGQEHG